MKHPKAICNTAHAWHRTIALTLALLCAFALALPIFSAETAGVEFEHRDLYSYKYDPNAHTVTILYDSVLAEQGELDILPLIKDAAEKQANFTLDLSSVKLSFDKASVAAFAQYEGKMHLVLQKIKRIEEMEAFPYEVPFGENVYALRVSFGDAFFSDGEPNEADLSIRMRLRYTTKAADNIRVLAYDESGTATEHKHGFESGTVYFDIDGAPTDMLYCILDSELPPSTPKLPYLLLCGLFVLVILSAVTIVLLKTGTLKRLYIGKCKRKTDI